MSAESAAPLYDMSGPVSFAESYDQLQIAAAQPTEPSLWDTDFAHHLPPAGELVTDLDKLASTMGALAVLAPQVGLAHLQYGLTGYRAVTKACTERLDEFDDEEKIQRTMPVFFEELARSLRLHVDGYRGPAIQGWEKHFYSDAAQNASPGLAMLDFLTAHVRYDLGVALLRTDTENRHRADYTERVNGILADVAAQIMPSYVQVPFPLDKLQADKVGRWLALLDLFGARDEAWGNFEAMREAKTLSDFEVLRAQHKQRAEQRMWSGNIAARWIVRAATRKPQGMWLGAEGAFE